MTDTGRLTSAGWPELHDAQRAVLLEVLIHGSRSRADLARRTNLSRATLMRLTRGLVELGLVTEGQTQVPAGRGRPSEMLHLRAEAAYFVGVKLTGDALYAVVTDLHAKILATEERILPSRDVATVVGLIAEVVDGFSADFPLTAAGVCLAGDVTYSHGDSTVLGSHFLGWENVPLGELVHSATGLATAISNDVQALTVAHHWFGVGVGCTTMALIGLGAGIGSGIVVNDEIVRGSRGHPGKVGHLFVTDTGPVCDRGHTGCVSSFVTIPAIVANSGASGFWEALAAAAAGDAVADLALRNAGHALGVVVASLADLIDPEKVIITGEALAVARYASDELDASIRRHLDPAAEPVDVELVDFAFADYAWAAAIAAIRHVV
ncbi:MAG: transcriptional regulator/sugar kinase [Glaciihabitans sp.]|nr:transcriptional regulator/sugar kinase [Glaciihabitans sp.]